MSSKRAVIGFSKSFEQFLRCQAKRIGETFDSVERQVGSAAFNPAHIAARESTGISKILLRNALIAAQLPHTSAQCLS